MSWSQGEQQPGYAASRSYLETLADLPWSRSAADVAAAARHAGATEGADAAAGGAAPGGPPTPALEAPMRLAAARQVLDKQHFGLEKIKDRYAWCMGGEHLWSTTNYTRGHAHMKGA